MRNKFHQFWSTLNSTDKAVFIGVVAVFIICQLVAVIAKLIR